MFANKKYSPLLSLMFKEAETNTRKELIYPSKRKRQIYSFYFGHVYYRRYRNPSFSPLLVYLLCVKSPHIYILYPEKRFVNQFI